MVLVLPDNQVIRIEMPTQQKLVFCSQEVNKHQIRRETRRGVEHIVIPSFTLPPDIVMNGGLYPSDEVEKSFPSLNRTPVTIEHPELDGMYVSANDPEIDFEYRFGAFNENAIQTDDGRISVDKVINVQKAMMSEKGKRLLDRVNELETSDNPRPMHTSVGVFVDAEDLKEPLTNSAGDEYKWIARNMIFDHDAILLDNIGAATPEQGTGIGINAEQIKVEHFIINEVEKATQDNSELIKPNEDNDMFRDAIIANLKKMGIEVNTEISDSDLLAKYNEAMESEETDNQPEVKPEVKPEVNNDNSELIETVKTQADELAKLQANAAAATKEKLDAQIKVIKANDKYSSISDSALMAIHANNKEDFDAMHQESIPSFGIGSTTEIGAKEDPFSFTTNASDLPE